MVEVSGFEPPTSSLRIKPAGVCWGATRSYWATYGILHVPSVTEWGRVGNRVRYIQRTVGEIGTQLDDHYHLLREIYEATTQENGADWYDLYE